MDNPLIQPDPGLYLWTIVTFLVLFALLRKYAWKPLLDALDSREQAIRKALEAAGKAKEEFQNLQGQSQEILSQAGAEAQSIIAESRGQAEKLKGEILQEARTRAEGIVEAAEKQIQAEKDKALRDIREEVVTLSLTVASKLIRQNITSKVDQALIEESMNQIESQS